MNIKLSVQQTDVITSMGSMWIESNGKKYWFMPCVFEETNIDGEFMVHEIPESITNKIADFIQL